MVLLTGGVSTTNTVDHGIVGGCNCVNGTVVAQAELYDPTHGTFIPAGTMKTPRTAHTATLLPNGSVLIAGGSSQVFGKAPLNTAEVFTLNASNPGASTFTLTGNNMSQARGAATATLTWYFDGEVTQYRVLVAGGFNSNFYPTGWDDTADLYDPGSNMFAATGHLSDARYSAVAVAQINGSVLVASGYALTSAQPGFGPVNNAELFHLDATGTGTFQSRPAMIVPRSGATAVGKFGGVNSSYGGIIVIMGGDANGTAEVYFSGVPLS
jgi:hypothetical protein